MIEDYPAAHSMDTDWFALDKEGHIASFHSGETGAVPRSFRDAYGVLSFGECLQAIFPRNGRGEAEVEVDLDPLMQVLSGSGTFFDDVVCNKPTGVGSAYSCLFHLRSEEILDIISEDDLVIRFKDERVVAYLEEYNLDLAMKAAEDGDVLGFYDPGDKVTAFLCTVLGLFKYDAQWHEPAEPYERVLVPETPMHCSRVSKAGRKILGMMTLTDLAFTEREIVQPPEHMESSLWPPYSWVGTDGRIHQIDEGDI